MDEIDKLDDRNNNKIDENLHWLQINEVLLMASNVLPCNKLQPFEIKKNKNNFSEIHLYLHCYCISEGSPRVPYFLVRHSCCKVQLYLEYSLHYLVLKQSIHIHKSGTKNSNQIYHCSEKDFSIAFT